jgi:hypothetical protein
MYPTVRIWILISTMMTMPVTWGRTWRKLLGRCPLDPPTKIYESLECMQVIDGKTSQNVSLDVLRREYEHGGDQEDAGLRTQFTGDSSIMSYSCIASKGESSPIEFDLDTLAYRTIVLKSTVHSGDRER